MPYLTTTQIAHWFGVSEKTVLARVRDGQLPKPWTYGDGYRFQADIILPLILNDPDFEFSGYVTLKTADGTIDFEVISPKYRFNNFGSWWAVFQVRDGSWHTRPWQTAYVMDIPVDVDVFDVILDCRDEATPEIDREELPDLCSSTWAFWKRWSEIAAATSKADARVPAWREGADTRRLSSRAFVCVGGGIS